MLGSKSSERAQSYRRTNIRNTNPTHVPRPAIEDFADEVEVFPVERTAGLESEIYGDKVVLCFEGPTNLQQAYSWVEAYNLTATTLLKIHGALINSLFAVQVLSSTPTYAVSKLVELSPIKILGRFAAINRFSATFNPENPIDFKQLIIVIIPQGSEYIYKLIDLVVRKVGTLVRSSIGAGTTNYRIVALVETTLRTFPSGVTIPVPPHPSTQRVTFEYLPQELRCIECFSNFHSVERCLKAQQASTRTGPRPPRAPAKLCTQPIPGIKPSAKGKALPATSDSVNSNALPRVHPNQPLHASGVGPSNAPPTVTPTFVFKSSIPTTSRPASDPVLNQTAGSCRSRREEAKVGSTLAPALNIPAPQPPFGHSLSPSGSPLHLNLDNLAVQLQAFSVHTNAAPQKRSRSQSPHPRPPREDSTALKPKKE